MTNRSGSPASTMVFTAFIVLTFYGLGAGYLESFVNYPLWRIIGETDRWVEYHQALGPRILLVLVIPALVLTLITNVVLLFFRPIAVPGWAVATALGLLLMATVSTAVVQIPIQMQLDVAYERAALDRLITSSLWLRDVVGGLRAALVAYMLHRVVSTSARVNERVQDVGQDCRPVVPAGRRG